MNVMESFYTSNKVLFWLALFGAYVQSKGYCASFGTSHEGGDRGLLREKQVVETDFYYSRREFGYRIRNPGNRFLHVRREIMVALQPLS